MKIKLIKIFSLIMSFFMLSSISCLAYADYIYTTNDGIFDNGIEIVFPERIANVTIEVYINDTKNDNLTQNLSDKNIDFIVNEDDAKAAVAAVLPEGASFVKSENVPLTVKDGNNVIKLYYEKEEQYILDKRKLRTFAKDKTGVLTFSTTPIATQTGTDLSEAGDGSIIGVVDGENVTIYSKNGKAYAPENCGQMFYASTYTGFKCSSMDFSGLDTSRVTNMSYIFCYCTNLTSLNLSNFDTSNVLDMQYMFDNCKRLTKITFGSNFNTKNVINMNGMFYECNALTSCNTDIFDTSNVTDMSWMFHCCSNLTSLDLRNFNTSKVVNMRAMFSGDYELTDINLSSFNTSNVTDMSIMFNTCTNLKTLDLSSFDTNKVTDMNAMFTHNTNLTILARTETDKTNLENSPYFPDTCTVIVKNI